MLTGIALVGIVGILLFWVAKRRQARVERQGPSEKEQRVKTDRETARNLLKGAEAQCSICLGRDCDSILPCGHTFHRLCIRGWLSEDNFCPTCRCRARAGEVLTL